MSEVNETKLEQVRKLLDRANHPNTPEPERDACIRKADALMLKHAIDEALLDATKKGDERLPVTRTFRAYSNYEFAPKFQTMLGSIAKTSRCRAAYRYNGDTTVVGMKDDVDYFEMLWTTVYLNFVSKLFPRWEDSLSFDHNVYNFKKAGYKWPAIKDVAIQNNNHVPWPDGGLLIRAYKRHAKLAGDDELIGTQKHAAYRESFAEGFVREIGAKLEQMRADAAETTSSGEPGTELALMSVRDRVNDAFYEEFPHLRPMTEKELQDLQDRLEREEQERQCKLEEELAAMTPAQRRKWEQEQERERRRQEKANERYWRDYDARQDRLYDPSGFSAGRKAGRETDLSAGSRGMGTEDRKGLES